MFPFALIERRPLKFLYHWAPFYLIIFLYDQFRAIADDLTQSVNFTLLPSLEQSLFGGIIPTVWLQERLLSAAHGALGTVLSFFYLGHFILPVAVLYLLWRKNLSVFRITIGAITLVSILGFITFALFPAAPPWMASLDGTIPKVERLILFHLNQLFTDWLPKLYANLSPNEVAPFPALHAAYPAVLFLASNKYFPRFKWLFLANTLIVSFTIVLFAEHYVIDIIAGWLYAFLSFVIINNLKLFLKVKGLRHKKR
ncbi:phosphatase PAP2 family protein [Patescibacteria group bacterium]|nr:phosphatase PAP2 family protein [Patescibacteria group bacterium]